MSFVYKEDRPKLKAKRFNKFEPSSNSRTGEGNIYNVPKKGCKRLCADDLNYSVQHKRICTTASLNISPPTKNLANNRLKNLKQQIQESLKTDKIDQKKINNVSTKSVYSRETEHRKNERDILKKEIFDKKNVKHELKDKFSKSAEGTSLIRTKKNLADERLQNIKKKLNSRSFETKSSSNLSNETKICNSTLQSPHCSSWRSNEDKKSTSLKRNISNVTNTCDLEDGSNYKKLSKRNVFPSKITEYTSPSRTEQNNSMLKENVMKTTFSPPFGTNTFACSTPIPKRLLNVKGTNADEYFSQNVELSKSRSSPTLQKLDQEDKYSAIHKPVTPVRHNEDNKSNVIDDGSDNFLNKIEMTTSWIKAHQDQYNFNTSAKSPVYCLNETKEQDGSKFDDGTEEMEWTNAEPDDAVTELNKVMEPSIKDKELTEIIKDPEKIKDVCVVVDTNAFISGLSKIRDIVNIKTTESFKPIIFVPWMVITELDYMKDSNHKFLKNVTNAIKFINAALKDNNPQVVGQTVFDVEKQKHIGTSPDDKIVSCCLQAAEKYETVILLSNDMNIKNKAMINGITACSLNEIMIKLMSKLVKNTKSQKIKNKMGIMCSSIICECMKAAYGDIWSKMDMMSNPPWSLGECLKRFKKYWTAVFREKLMKQFTKTLQDLLDVIETNKFMSDDSVEFVEFMKLCVALCIFLKDIEECRGVVECTLADITKAA